MSADFGWSGLPGSYGVVGGAIAHVHGNSVTPHQPSGVFNYYWVDDHINVAADIGSNCSDTEQSLRYAMITVLGHAAINEDKFTPWSSRQKALGLIFDTEIGHVAMPRKKIEKAKTCVAAALTTTSLSRSEYRSLLGRLRHVATCVRPARPFLQRLRRQENQLRRWDRVPVSADMRQDLCWWSYILRSPLLNGVPLQYFHNAPPPDIIVEMNASDSGLCALVSTAQMVLQYTFFSDERQMIDASKLDSTVGFDINYREILSCAFAVHTWGPAWSRQQRSISSGIVHVQFRIDNTSAVAWENNMSSRNPRAQTVIRLLGYWEAEYRLRFSAAHVAGVDNRIADAGSRVTSSAQHASLFAKLT